MKKIILCMMMFVLPVGTYAETEIVEEVDYIREIPTEYFKQVSPKLHKAEGIHQCQSSESIGHTCKNLGVNFMDCNQAFYSLKRDDCCSGSKYGGVSIGFKMVKCSTIY